MNSIRVFNQRIVYMVAVAALLLSIVIPIVVSAATVTDRSIAVSSAAKGAENVSYNVQFTATGAAAAFVIDFCKNTPLIGEACTAPDDFSVSSAATTDSGYTINAATSTNRLVVDTSITTSEAVAVQINNVANPSVAGPLYARIVTFDTTANAATADAETLVGSVDQGSVVIPITEAFSVSGTVLETLTFCVSGTTITGVCTGGVTAPTLRLGEDQGNGIFALEAGTVSTGDIYTMISTNAASGAVVRLKSNAEGCGGLLRAGSPSECDIAPAQTQDILPNSEDALFGVKTAASTGAPDSGAFAPVSGSNYNNSTYALNFTPGASPVAGVTSTFGDPFLDTNSAPANARSMTLTFGATITNQTPAGTYSADLSLIAVGKF